MQFGPGEVDAAAVGSDREIAHLGVGNGHACRCERGQEAAGTDGVLEQLRLGAGRGGRGHVEIGAARADGER